MPVGAEQGGERESLFGPQGAGGPGVGEVHRETSGRADQAVDGLTEVMVDPVA